MSADDFPRSLSASRIGDFTTCPLLFRFRTIDRIPEAPAPAAIMGTLMHTALEDLFDLPAVDRTPDAAHELFEAAWVELQEEDVEAAAAVIDRVGSAPDLIASYFAIEDPVRLEPHAGNSNSRRRSLRPSIFVGMSIESTRHPMVAFASLTTRPARHRDRSIRTSRCSRCASTPSRGGAFTKSYPAMLQLLFLGNREILRYEPTESDLLATERRVLSVRDAISAAADTGEFTPTPSKLCDWCDHQSICPAKGGTPPPIPPRDLWLEKTPFTKR
jgi:putative RecB family exonuclease